MRWATWVLAFAILGHAAGPAAAAGRGKGPVGQPSALGTQTDAYRTGVGEAASPPVLGVFGDVFAQSVARGLEDGDALGTTWTLSDHTSEELSLTGSDAAVPARLLANGEKQAGHVDAAVLMIGRNDDAPLRDAHGASLAPGSPEWRTLYGDRVEALAAAFRDRHVPLLWVGLPIVRDTAQAQRYAAINAVIRDRAVKGGATFADSWQAFADDNGDFAATGPDVNGRIATLRWTNGWNFTRAGSLKLASFILPDIKRMHDRVRAADVLAVVPNANPDAFDQALSIDVNAQIRREAGLPVAPEPAARKPAGPVVALTAAPISDRGVLLPLPTQPRTGPVKAEPEAPHPGRADDFTWPRP